MLEILLTVAVLVLVIVLLVMQRKLPAHAAQVLEQQHRAMLLDLHKRLRAGDSLTVRLSLARAGGLEARTSNGAVQASLSAVEPGRPLRVKTSNGRIDLALAGWKDTDVEASTSNGAITVRLPEGAGARLNARTSNGAITSDFEVSGAGAHKRTHLEGLIGSGGPRLSLTTSNGSIRIEGKGAK